jgi:hypothetical protein
VGVQLRVVAEKRLFALNCFLQQLLATPGVDQSRTLVRFFVPTDDDPPPLERRIST